MSTTVLIAMVVALMGVTHGQGRQGGGGPQGPSAPGGRGGAAQPAQALPSALIPANVVCSRGVQP